MLFSSRTTAAVTAAALGAVGASAAITTSCPENNNAPCYSWGAHPSSNNVYFQVRAPATFAWAGIGIGQDMFNAAVFVIYQNGDGNVTVSTRQASQQAEPSPVQRSGVTLLAGSGVIDNVMVANVRCNNCPMLSSLTGTSNWITAWKTGSAIDSTSNSAEITYHDGHAQLQVNLANAQLSEDENPFVSSDSSSGNGNGNSSGNGNSNGGNSPVITGTNTNNTLLYAHGILMMIVWTAMYPLGAVLMPLVGKWYIHAGWQTTAFLAMWAAVGVGYTMAHQRGLFFNNTHTQLGIFACALMSIQPIIGVVHHRGYKKTQSRSLFSYAHIWYGRSVMVLGIVNGGLGLQLAGTEGAMKQAYIAMAAIFPVLYAAGVVYRLTKGKASFGREKTPPSPNSAA